MPARPKKLSEKVEAFGLSPNAINLLLEKFPKANAAKLLRSFSKYLLAAESVEEFKWLKVSKPTVENYMSMPVVFERPKSLTFKLPGNEYTPDFTYLLEDGTYLHVEVKASKFQPNYRDARSKLRMTATLFPEQVFAEVMPNKAEFNGWSFELIEPDAEYGDFFKSLSITLQGDNE